MWVLAESERVFGQVEVLMHQVHRQRLQSCSMHAHEALWMDQSKMEQCWPQTRDSRVCGAQWEKMLA
jgi:hypothetical protein